jgi:hypothetical protein
LVDVPATPTSSRLNSGDDFLQPRMWTVSVTFRRPSLHSVAADNHSCSIVAKTPGVK